MRRVHPESGVGESIGHRSHVVLLRSNRGREQWLGQVRGPKWCEQHVVAGSVLELLPVHSDVANRFADCILDQFDVARRVAVGEVGVGDVELLC